MLRESQKYKCVNEQSIIVQNGKEIETKPLYKGCQGERKNQFKI